MSVVPCPALPESARNRPQSPAGGAPQRPSGSTSRALAEARRGLRRRGAGLVLGGFLLHGLLFSFVPHALTLPLPGGLRTGELVAAAQVLLVAAGVWAYDRGARRRVDPLASRLPVRRRDTLGWEFTDPQPAAGRYAGPAFPAGQTCCRDEAR